jgi:hypothetical protein
MNWAHKSASDHPTHSITLNDPISQIIRKSEPLRSPLGYIKVTSGFWVSRIFGNEETRGGVFLWLHEDDRAVSRSSIFHAHL